MAASRKTKKRRLYTVIIGVIVLFCLVMELGRLVPTLGIPSWDDLYAAAGLAGEQVTPQGELQVHFIDVGNADCVLIRQGEANALIDAGERGDGEAILRYLREQGVKQLDLAIATHPHADHIGSMAQVVEAFPPKKLVMSFMPESATPTTTTYLSMLQALDAHQVPVEEAKPGAVYALGTARLTVLAPLETSDNANDISVMTRLTFGDNSFLFTGDAEVPVEKAVLASGRPVQADVLKVAHHGSDTSNSSAWLARVSPSAAVIPCGTGNSYNHPHKEVLQRLEKQGTAIYRTDVSGHIVFKSDGKTLAVKTQK